MLVAAALTVLVAGASALPPPAPTAVAAVPDEPEAFFLPEAETAQAVVVDLDADGAREVVRLVRGERGAIALEVWTDGPRGWEHVGGGLEVVPERPGGAQPEVDYAGAPARLIVRDTADRERLTLVRQPRYAESDLDRECCMLLHDVRLSGRTVEMVVVADAAPGLHALLALDLDGDGTDELVGSYSLPVLGYPTELTVYRWEGEAFAPPLVSSPARCCPGDTPFPLGDSDGLPGEELGFISSRDGGVLHRVALRDGGLTAETAGLVASGAVGVPIPDGAGIAVVNAAEGVSVRTWRPDERPTTPAAESPMRDALILGVVPVHGEPHLVLHQPSLNAAHVLGLPDLAPLRGPAITRTPAAAALVAAPVRTYTGPIPGGGPGGGAAVVYGGRLLPAEDAPEAPIPVGTAPVAAMAGVQPVGLAGSDGAWMGFLHAPLGIQRLDPAGGALDAPRFEPASNVSLARVETVLEPEADLGALDPPTRGGTPVRSGVVAIGDEGFVAQVEAPPGSRVYVADADPSVIALFRAVPPTGHLDVPVVPPSLATPNPRFRASLAVVTPAGHGYVASWNVQLLTEAPALSASVRTPFASPTVEIQGRTAAYAEVTVDGAAVEVAGDGTFLAHVALPPWPTSVRIVATDPVGHRTETVVTGVGLVDYRELPWIPISVALVAAAALLLILHVPRVAQVSRRADDDAVLEEIEPD